MEKYQIIQKAGSGNFSEVYKARNLLTDEIVAIKEMKNLDKLQQLALKELKVVSNLDHPNIIKLKQIIRSNKQIRVVFQFMDENLLQLYSSFKNGTTQNQLRCILYQAALALEYLHSNHIIHRDIKPQNILISRKSALIKIIDFGLAKEQYMATTDYVATRWYRSPENLIGMRKSTTAIDIFALGCVAVQLFTLNPLFPGDDTIDQLNKIFNILGTPTYEDWTKGYLQLKKKNLFFNQKPKLNLKNFVVGASPQFVDLLEKMLILNPQNRITAKNMLSHPFFRNVQKVIPQHIYKQAEKIREQIQIKQKKKISLSKVMPVIESRSPKHQNFQFRNNRIQTGNDSIDRVPLKTANRQQTQNNENKVYESRSKKYNYLNQQKIIMPNLVKTQSQSIYQKSYQTINPNLNNSINNSQKRLVFNSPTTERKGFIQRNTNQKIVAGVKYVPKQIIYNRITRNNSLINESSLIMNRSLQKVNIDMNINNTRSFNQLKNYSYVNNHNLLGSPYKRNNFRGY